MSVSTEERRRGIALVVERRPGVGLDELQRLLARAGVTVDRDTLASDLRAMGLAADEPPAPATSDQRPGGWRRQPLAIAAAVIALVVVAVVVVLVVGGSDDDTEPVVVGEPPPEESTTSEPARVAPPGPGRDPALDDPAALVDDFERSGIGDYPGVDTWAALNGEWANTDGNLDLVAPASGAAVIAVDPDVADLRAEVRIDRPASRAGLAFRIVDAENFLLWAMVPDYDAVVLFEVVDGSISPVADSGLVEFSDEPPTLGIAITGTTVELYNDGVVAATYDAVPPADGATRIGVAVLPHSDGLPLFDDMRVLAPSTG